MELLFIKKDKSIEVKQTKVGLNCCQNKHCGKTEQVKEFGYLVSMITTDVKFHMAI